MAADFLERLKQSPVLCDGAMGTLLYAKGIFINAIKGREVLIAIYHHVAIMLQSVRRPGKPSDGTFATLQHRHPFCGPAYKTCLEKRMS